MKTIAYLYVIVVFSLYGCQSAPPEPPAEAPQPVEAPVPAPDPSFLRVDAAGFSPVAPRPADTLPLSLHFGRSALVSRWAVEFLGPGDTLVAGFGGDGSRLPPTLAWSGRDARGQVLPEGEYRARLTVFHDGSEDPEVSDSEPFVVDVTPPSGSVEVSPNPITPGDLRGPNDPPLVTFQLNLVPGGGAISSWRMGILHPDGRRFFDFISEDHRDNIVRWNGRALNNASLDPGVDYEVEVQVFDQYSNIGYVRSRLSVLASDPGATAVSVSLDGAVLAATQIYFPPYSSDLRRVRKDLFEKNQQALAQLYDILRNSPATSIRIVGHANRVFWQDPVKGDREQREVLLPLSAARAAAVRSALGEFGAEPELFEISGVGSDGAVADFGDQKNNWKNRRVEFLLAH